MLNDTVPPRLCPWSRITSKVVFIKSHIVGSFEIVGYKRAKFDRWEGPGSPAVEPGALTNLVIPVSVSGTEVLTKTASYFISL